MKHSNRILAFLFIILFSSPAFALSCVAPSLERDLENADIIFHGSIQKVEASKLDETINKITVTVESPILNVKEGDVITIYHKHWLQREKDWEESETERRHGIFALNKMSDTTVYQGTKIEGDVYYVGMCGQLYFPEIEENLELLEKVQPENNI